MRGRVLVAVCIGLVLSTGSVQAADEWPSQVACQQASNTPCWETDVSTWRATGTTGVVHDQVVPWDQSAADHQGSTMPTNVSGTAAHPVVAVDMRQIAFPDALPYLDPGANRTMVPVRFVAQELGATVTWNDQTRSAEISRETLRIVLPVGGGAATVNGSPIETDAPAVIVPPGRIMVPLRFVSQAFGATVDWVGGTAPVPGYSGRYQVSIWPAWGWYGTSGIGIRLQTDWFRRN